MRQLFRLLVLVCAVLAVSPAVAGTLPTVRVAALKFGTVNWELDVIKRHQLDQKFGFQLEVIELVSPNASAVSLQGGAADIIVTDWLWVANQHAHDRPYRYYPYSTAVGELLVPGDSPVNTLDDLARKSLGVAGGSQDKTWRIFRAYTRASAGYDLAERVQERYAAPPLLNGLAETGQLDGVLTYWHFGAALKAQGYRSLLTLDDALAYLGIKRPVPMLGWVFSQQWSRDHPELVNAFLAASYEAKSMLLRSDQEWQRLRPRMHAADDRLFEQLVQGYRQGVPQGLSAPDLEAIGQVWEIIGGDALAREVEVPPAEIFWQQFDPSPALVNHGN